MTATQTVDLRGLDYSELEQLRDLVRGWVERRDREAPETVPAALEIARAVDDAMAAKPIVTAGAPRSG